MRSIVRSGLIACAIWLAAAQAHAQYPAKPIRLIVPFAAGSTNDIVARFIGPPLSEAVHRRGRHRLQRGADPRERPRLGTPRRPPAPAHADHRLGQVARRSSSGCAPGRARARRRRKARHRGQRSAPRDPDIPPLEGSSSSREGAVDRVIIAFTRAGHEQLLRGIRLCRNAGVAVDIVPRLFEFLDGARTSTRSATCRCSRSPRRVPRLARRQAPLDIVGAADPVAPTPLLLATALAIKLDSRGPVLFAQRRPGHGGPFLLLYKFRSMGHDATVECAGTAHRQDARRHPHHQRRPVPPPLLARRGAADFNVLQGRHEPRRAATARGGRGRALSDRGMRAAPTSARA